MTCFGLNRAKLSVVLLCIGLASASTAAVCVAGTIGARANTTGGSTTLALTMNPDTVLAGGTTTLTATVSNVLATGLVHFINVPEALEMGSAALIDGVASFSRGPLSPGDYSFQAHYDGDQAFLASTSPAAPLHVGGINPTAVTIRATHSFALQGSLDTLLLNVVPADAGGTFMVASPGNGYAGPWNMSPLSGAGKIVLSLNGSPGLIPFKLHFTGNPFYFASDDTARVQVFGPSATTTLSAGPPHPKAGDLVSLHATINAPSPSGSVSFYVDNAFLGVANVIAGAATFSTTGLAIGSRSVYASWSGENSKASVPLAVRVTGAAAAQLALALVPSPGVIRTGSTFSVKAIMTPPQVSGIVSFTNSAGQSGDNPIVAGVATAGGMLSTLGFYTYRASFAGDDVYRYSSDSTTVEVDASTSNLLLFSDVNPSAIGQLVTFTTQLEGLPQGGTATLYIDNVPVDSAAVTSGFYSYPTAALAMGIHTIDVKYSGAPLQTSPAFLQSVGTTAIPGLHVTSPNGYETLVVGSHVTIAWDPDTAGMVPFVDVGVAREGSNWEIVGTHVPNSGSFEWTVTGPGLGGASTANRRARVAVFDQTGHIGSDQSDATFWLLNAGTLDVPAPAEAQFALGPITPNPVTGSGHFDFSVARASHVRLSVIDLQGREVAVIAEGNQAAGTHRAQWDGRDARGALAAGVYFVRYETPVKTMTSRFAVIR